MRKEHEEELNLHKSERDKREKNLEKEKDKLKQTRVAKSKEFASRRAKNNPRNKQRQKSK